MYYYLKLKIRSFGNYNLCIDDYSTLMGNSYEKINKIIEKHSCSHIGSCDLNSSCIEKTLYVIVPKKHLKFFLREFENPIEVIIEKRELKDNYDYCQCYCFSEEFNIQEWETKKERYEVIVDVMKS
tara:strand:+ start:870 stop:1247 length:378 start_codon:yes stop_codon:yes gene_type:complete